MFISIIYPFQFNFQEKGFLISMLEYLVKPWGAREMEKGKHTVELPVAI